MWQNAQDAYLEGRVLAANPVELVGLLYHASTDAVREARRHLAEGEIAARSRAICRASDILTELTTALDFERGGEISTRLALLYDYMRRRLTDANFQQSDGPLAEVLGLLATLSEAWDAVGRQSRAAVPTETPWAPTAAPEGVAAGSEHGWSF
jgi:flagellar secretion chaperone FliS